MGSEYGVRHLPSSPVPCTLLNQRSLRGFMKRIFGSAIILFFLSVPVLATTRIDLDHDWQFSVDPQERGETSGWQKQLPPDTESVNVPHTWNIGKHDNYLGK